MYQISHLRGFEGSEFFFVQLVGFHTEKHPYGYQVFHISPYFHASPESHDLTESIVYSYNMIKLVRCAIIVCSLKFQHRLNSAWTAICFFVLLGTSEYLDYIWLWSCDSEAKEITLSAAMSHSWQIRRFIVITHNEQNPTRLSWHPYTCLMLLTAYIRVHTNRFIPIHVYTQKVSPKPECNNDITVKFYHKIWIPLFLN